VAIIVDDPLTEIKKRSDGWVDISGGEDIGYTEVHVTSMDEACSGTFGAIKEDPGSMLIFILGRLEAAG